MSLNENAGDVARASKLGFVVIGRNEGDQLVRCLKSLRVETPWLVYVDSGSTDGSQEAARRLGAQVVALDPSRPFTAARARNVGAKLLITLHPDILFLQFIDGDCELRAEWISAAFEFMAVHEDVAVVCGRRRERDISASVYNRLCDLEWDTRVGPALGCGGDSFMRVAAFQEVGGFAEGLIAGEEPELCVRLRAKEWDIWRLDSEMTLHDAALKRFRQWWMRSVRGGHAMAQVATLHWRDPGGIWKKELMSALFWGLLAPACIFLTALCFPVALSALLIYPAQIGRIAIVRGPTAPNAWIYALFVTLAKFAESQGAATYYWRLLFHRTAGLIEYK